MFRALASRTVIAVTNSSFQRVGVCHRGISSTEREHRHVQVSYLDGDHSGIAVLGLQRPEAKNSLSRNLVSQIFEALEAFRYDKGVRVVVLRSLVPKIFCAGADLKERATFTESQVNAFVNSLRHLTNVIENLPCPVIAAIDGAALGGGLEIALACDLRTASTTSKMGLVETRLAIIPGAGGSQRLPRLIGVPKAKELIYTAKVISGEEALHIGLVNAAVTQNSNGDAAYCEALSLASNILPNGPIGVQMAKSAINKGSEVDIATGCYIEEACYARLIPTRDRLEGLQAFKEKRSPRYKGE